MDFLPSYERAAKLVVAYAAQLHPQCENLEEIDLGSALGRVLARPIFSDTDQPPFARSTRDGFACRAAEASTHQLLQFAGSTHAGEAPAGPLPPAAAWEIMTGAPIPADADAVAMVEHIERVGSELRLLSPRTLKPGENIVAQGAQARQGERLLPVGTLLGFAQIALAATCGYASLSVYRRPRVAILTTGDELVPVDAVPGPGQIRNSNAPMLAALVSAAGGEPRILPTAADTAEALDVALEQAIEADLLLISGGVSAGKFDLVEPALARAGAKFHFTGVLIQPGKPLVFGELAAKDGANPESERGTKCFFGLPGNPVSSAVTFSLFGVPVLAALAGRKTGGPRFALARLVHMPERQAKSSLTRFLAASCNFSSSIDELPEVTLLNSHGSGDLTALARSNCFLVVPEEAPRLEAGDIVRILLS